MSTVGEAVGTIQGTLYLAILVIAYFTARLLKQVDSNQKELFERMNDHEIRLSHIEGEHKVAMESGAHSRH
jgi:hypothetical protein